ncbi:hypothetical protein GSH19_03510 [Lactobacillus sp. S2-2]|uniref:hypothetical protein n=1 Tax=Lactobacillus sp. S2-2 TaxID=2692917 RepID=UPI001F2A88AD|nr:hypothetical protein [Lactobacillus sp. S2-2]MCF6515221.1 hypothetical protein [Lactobacillus sp. S2-2]
MKRKSIILFAGVVIFGFGLFNQITDAKSTTKVVNQYEYYNHGEDRDFVSTGKTPLYSKPGKSKVVISTKSMKKLSNSKSTGNVFRAYRTVTLSNGQTFTKVVSMNGKYRGFVKSNGVKQIKTLTNVDLSNKVQGQLVTLSNVKAHPIFESPSYTQYQINRLKYDHVHDKDLFVIDGAVKKTVGGQLYYHVTSTKDKMINGYVYAGKGYLDNQINSSFGGLSLVAR